MDVAVVGRTLRRRVMAGLRGVMVAESVVERPLTVDDVLNEPSAHLGSADHAVSLVDAIVLTLRVEARALTQCGADEDALRIMRLLAEALDARDGMGRLS